MQQQTVRLLILNDSPSEAERLISMLQNAGRPVRATHIDSEEAISKLLLEKVWDLMIAHENTKNVTPARAVQLIRQHNKDVPLIIISEREEAHACVEGIKLGARDVVRVDEDQHLLLVIERELNNRLERESRRASERLYAEIAHRNQSLLDNSRDAIAFVQDGMFLYVNESFAELLKYQERSELEYISIIDIIADKHHKELKDLLKNVLLKSDESESKNITLSVVAQDGSDLSLDFEVNKAVYDDESCIQILYRFRGKDAVELEAKLEKIKNVDAQTGLYNKSFLIDKLQQAISSASTGKFNSVVLHIGIDNLQQTVSEKLGVGSLDKTLENIAKFAKTQIKNNEILCRYSDDSFVLLSTKMHVSQSKERAQQLCNALREHTVEVNNKTLHFNYHIGVSAINGACSDIDTPIDQSLKALQTARKHSEENPAETVAIYRSPKDEKTNNSAADIVASALEHDRFKLLFQPILSLRGEDTEHYEVLLRMLDDNGEHISPNEFLNEAQELGMAGRIDRWVILEATKVLSEHIKAGHNTRLVIHLCKDAMLDNDLAAWLKVVFKTAELAPESIIFQINEVDINDHLTQATEFVTKVREFGGSISINHFGCALNPFKLLNQVDANYIKIDGSFTEDVKNNENGAQALNDLIAQLHQSEKITIVPFVENASVLSKLWQSGVHYIQGYYLQEPSSSMNYDFDTEG